MACPGCRVEKITILAYFGRTVTFSVGLVKQEGGIIAGEAISSIWVESVASLINKKTVAANTIMSRRTPIRWFSKGLRSIAPAMSIEEIIIKATQALALGWLICIATRAHLQAFPIRQVLPIPTLYQLTLIVAI